MQKFFNPASIAIIGASEQPGKIGNIIIKNLLELKYAGKILPVNPKSQMIEGLTCFANVSQINEPVDLAIIVIPASLVPNAVKECAEKSQPIKNIIVISAGFAEAGEAGKQLESQIVELAKQHQLKIMGPNCLGVINPGNNLNASFSKNNFEKGNVGLIMQSGAFTTAMFDLAKGENLGFSLVATLGNKAVMDEVDFLKYFADDENTKVVGMYLEDIKRGPEFCEALRRTTAIKPVVIIKAGNSAKAQKAMQSHTGAMAGQADVAKTAILDNGGLFFDNLTDFISAIKLLSGFKKPMGQELVIVTNAGGPGVIVTDAIEKNQHIHLKEFSDKEKTALKTKLPEASSVENPIDVLGDADDKRYKDVFKTLGKMKDVSAAIAIVTPQAQTDIRKISSAMISSDQKLGFPVLPVVMGTEADKQAQKKFKKAGFSNFVYPSGLINALEAVAASQMPSQEMRDLAVNTERQTNVQAILNEAQQREALYYLETEKIALLYGINAAKAWLLTEPTKPADLDFPSVMKIDSTQLLHKNTKNGVMLNINSEEKFAQALSTLRQNFPNEKIIAQHQERAGLEIILGLKKDPTFGHVLMLGLGGILTEILAQKILWILPQSRQEIERKIRNSIFEKVFAKQKIDLHPLIDLLEKVSLMAMENPAIKELDINPMIFYTDQASIAVDIKILV